MGNNETAANGRGNGAAMRLRDSLDAYAHFISHIYNAQVLQEEEKIAPELTQNPLKQADEPAKSWERHTFEGPVAANLATLEALKMDVYRQEQQLLELLNGRLGANPYVGDSLIAINMPTTEVVTAGLPFQTRMTVALTSRFFQPSFSSGNGQISLTDGGNAAILNVLADGSQIPSGKEEGVQRYAAMIDLPTRTGTERIPVQGSFKVRRPEVVVTSEAMQVLYRNCANAFRIDVPSLGEVYDPVITARGADIHKSATEMRRFLVTPSAGRCQINVATRSQGKVVPLRDMAYRVIEPPAPTIEMKVNGRAYNGLAAIPRSSRLSLRIKPDRSFFESFPKDARYRVRNVKIMLKEGLQPPRVVATVSVDSKKLSEGANLRLPSEVRQARRGAMLYVQLDDIERVNYKGQTERDGRFPESQRTFAFSLR
jgi:gliding motility-associated protein GldM